MNKAVDHDLFKGLTQTTPPAFLQRWRDFLLS